MILETKRLFLREMNMDDYDALYAVLADKDIMQHYPYVFDENRVRSWIERNMQRYKENGFGLWAVCLKETGEMIGDCGLTLQNIDGKMLPEIGYHIRKDCQRKGYAKEAASAVRDWAFEHTDYPSIYSWRQMRVCHMHEGAGRIRLGVYACSPEDSSFTAVFSNTKLVECAWKAHDGQQPD